MGSLGLGAKQRLPRRVIGPSAIPSNRSAEALLRAARVEIDREKLHCVVDHPFFNSMRFKELEMRLITLEFTGDGRFAYCERGAHKEVTIYEGALMKPTGSGLRFTADGADDADGAELEQQDTSGPSTEAGEYAVIEGRGIVRYERSEAGVSTNVERGEYRFAIKVTPCFKSTEMEAWVQPLFMTSGQRQTRKHLALVDAQGNFLGEAFGEKNIPEIPSRPSSRCGFSTGLLLERAADPKRYARPKSALSGLDGDMTFPRQIQRTRSLKKNTLGSSSSLSELRNL
jgi:hypothetical protein